MAMSGNRGPGGMLAEINVTPMVDVMLVLLIIFMVTAPMIDKTEEDKRKVDLELPVTRDNPNQINPEDSDKMILEISRDLKVHIGETLVVDCSAQLEGSEKTRFEPCFEEIELKLGANQKLQDEGEIYLLADTEIPYGFVVGTMARIKKAGIDKLGMVTNPEYLTDDAEPQE